MLCSDYSLWKVEKKGSVVISILKSLQSLSIPSNEIFVEKDFQQDPNLRIVYVRQRVDKPEVVWVPWNSNIFQLEKFENTLRLIEQFLIVKFGNTPESELVEPIKINPRNELNLKNYVVHTKRSKYDVYI